jgi:hypothetical protein
MRSEYTMPGLEPRDEVKRRLAAAVRPPSALIR